MTRYVNASSRFSWTLTGAFDSDAGRAWCATLPELGAKLVADAVILRGRNLLWRCRALERDVVVKRFGAPRSLLGRVGARLRASKATRSFHAAGRIRAEGFATPEPFAAVDLRRRGKLLDSWYCCADQPHHGSLRESRDDRSESGLTLAREVGAFVARLHRRRVLHGDLNATNVLLVDGVVGDARFSLIDLNRVRFRRVGLIAGVWNLQRLGFSGAARDALFEGYRVERGVGGGLRALDALLGRAWRGWWTLKSWSRPLRRRLGR